MRLSFAATACALVLTLRPAAASAAAWPWRDPSLPVAARLDALLAKLSMPQKLTWIHGTIGPYDGYVPGIPDLDVPSLDLGDGSAGIRSSTTSSALPMPLGLAATWNRTLAAQYGETLGRDARALGINALLGPMVNIDRIPAGGRNFESLGEDPDLAAGMVVPEIESVQAQSVIAVVKHYAVNSQQNGRRRDSMDVDMRTFHEIYLPAFAAAVREAHVGGIMCAYNQVNTSWSCENKQLYDVLRKELGFDGFVVSDWYAQHDIYLSIFNGLDLEMPVGAIYGPYLTQAVEHGNVKPALIDQHIGRTLGAMLRLGLFDHPPTKTPLPAAADLAVARRVVDEGAVLLKNDGNLLPLDVTRVRSLALIGPNIEPAPTFGGGSARVETPAGVPGPLSAIRAAVGPATAVTYAYAQGIPFMDDVPTVDLLALQPPSGNGHGLLGEYFASADLSGTPSVTRVDQSVAFDLHHLGIDSARWTGTLRVPVTGAYAIAAEGACACRIVVGTTTLVDTWASPAVVKPVPMTLQAGIAYPLAFSWHRGGDNFARLEWEPPAGAPALDIQRAAAVAKSAQVAVVFAGDFETEGRDRTTLALMGRQNELIEAVAAANPRTVVVLNTGAAILMDPWLASVRSVLDMWYPGEAAGLATADLLFGAVNPSGKMPVTFPARADVVPATVAYGPEPADGPARSVPYVERLDVGYRWYDAHNNAPLFPFGFGLSYTTFALSNLQVSPRSSDPAQPLAVSVDVTNSGQRPGSEVVQLYVSDPAELGEPPRQLRGFEKVALAPGETKHVTLQMPRRAFAIWEDPGGWHVHGGTYTIAAGSSSRDLPLTQQVDIPPG